MSCELTQTRLHAYLDGELDAAGASDFGRHLEACSECSTALDAQEKMRTAMRHSRLYSRAPAGLKLRIEESLPGPRAGGSARVAWWRWLAIAATAVAAIVIAANWRSFSGGAGGSSRGGYNEIAMAAVDAHLRSLQPGHLVDVQSTDQHTVKPWFDGKLDFAPPVRDFAANDFPLLGGRLDVIEGRTVAALVYGRRKHFINVFVATARRENSWQGAGNSQGYHWTAWAKNGFAFCAVSDVSNTDLDQLKQLFQQD